MRKLTTSIKVAVLLTLVLCGTISLVACASKETRLNTFSVGASPVVEVTVGNGDVSLVVGPEGEITVTAELQKPDRVEYEVSQDGDTITVHAKTRSGSRVDVTVTVPGNTDFGLSTGNGNVDAVGVQAPGRVHSGNGSIMLEQVRGNVEGEVGNGNITLGDVAGSFKLHVGNGNITVRDAIGSFNLSTGNGSITFQGELPPGSDNTFTTGTGDVTVELMGSPSAALDLESEDGKVRCDLPITISEKSEWRLVGTIGNGEAALTVRTGTANITIK